VTEPAGGERPFLSLIVPAYNEAERLPRTLPQLVAFVAAQPYAAEVLIVDNGSTDATGAIVAAAAAEHPFVRLLREPRRGKGAAVRAGMLAARGEYRFMADADLSMPIAEANKLLPPAVAGFDVAIASREAPGAVRYDEPDHRHLMGRAFNWLVRLLAVRGIHDTQCGFKCFRGEVARDLFALQRLDGWSFDVEVLFLARRRGCRIVEVPIHWYYREQSRVSPLRDPLRMLLGVVEIRANAWRGRYGPAGRPLRSGRE
jgi:glycosyltransferase involved in cell wall biosynthesis